MQVLQEKEGRFNKGSDVAWCGYTTRVTTRASSTILRARIQSSVARVMSIFTDASLDSLLRLRSV